MPVMIDIDMPDRCGVCTLSDEIGYLDTRSNCNAVWPRKSLSIENLDERPTWCPLVELYVEKSCGGTIIKYTE